MKLPIYDISINLEDEDTLMTTISLVTDPAVEKSFECFDKNEKPMQFAITNEDKHCITGVAIRCGVPIYRYSPEMGEYYVRFTEQTIEDIVFKYSKMNLWNSVSLEHSGDNITDAIMIEYFIKGKGKNPEGFEDVEDGSLFVTYKITNDELWDTIKNTDKINGFSIEVFANLVPTNDVVEEEAMTEEDKAIMELIKWFEGEEDIDLIFEDDKKKDELKFMTVGNVLNYLNEGKICEVTVNGKDTWCQLYNVTGTGEEAKVQVFVPDAKRLQIAADEMNISGYYREANVFSNGDKWKTIKIDDIDRIRPSKLPCVSYNYDLPSFKPVVEPYDPNKTTKTEVQGAVDSIEYAMDNNLLVMLKYNDESDEPATGMRQILIGGWGQTLRNNDAIVAYEYYGDSSTGIGGGAWRIFLTRRIQSFKVNTLAEPIFIAPTGYNNSDSWDNMGMLYKRAKFLM